jgi:hypothetical protein
VKSLARARDLNSHEMHLLGRLTLAGFTLGSSLIATKYVNDRARRATAADGNDRFAKIDHPQQHALDQLKPDARVVPTRAQQIEKLKKADADGASLCCARTNILILTDWVDKFVNLTSRKVPYSTCS